MQCPEVPKNKCYSECMMWCRDDRCPNLDWLGPFKSEAYAKKNTEPRPEGTIRIER